MRALDWSLVASLVVLWVLVCLPTALGPGDTLFLGMLGAFPGVFLPEAIFKAMRRGLDIGSTSGAGPRSTRT